MTDNTTAQTAQPTENFDQSLLDGMRVDPAFNEPILQQVLRIAVYDEYHAFETYRLVIEKFGAQPPFSNIIQAEIRHIEALDPLLVKYGVDAPVNDWVGKIELPNTFLEACELGVAAEIDNIKMYDNLIGYADAYPDVKDLLFRLQAASYNNHLPAFRSAVQRHYTNPVDINTIYEQFSTHNPAEATSPNADMVSKMNEFNEIAGKLVSGQMSQEDLMKVLGNTNLSFIGGALVGALGLTLYAQMNKAKNTEEGEA